MMPTCRCFDRDAGKYWDSVEEAWMCGSCYIWMSINCEDAAQRKAIVDQEEE